MYTILTIILGIVLWKLASSICYRFDPDLQKIPGPTLAAWTRLWRLWDVLKGRAHDTAIDLHRKHGQIVRMGPGVVSISDPAAIPTIYNTRGTWTKTDFYPIQSATWKKTVHFNIFSVVDEQAHREMKRKVAAEYTNESLLEMEDKMNEIGDLLVKKLEGIADGQAPFDFGAWLHYYAADVVGSITFNEKFGFLDLGKDVDSIIAAGEFMQYYFSFTGQIPILHKILLGNPLLPYILPGFEAANAGLQFTLRALERRAITTDAGVQMKEGQSGTFMLSKWAAIQSKSPDKMDMDDLTVALSTNIFAAIDTTAISLRAVFYFLLKNPAKLQKAIREIDDAYQKGQLSDPITDRESRNHLPYINAVIKESLRLFPAVGLLLERVTPESGAEICGTRIPGGTIVGINPWVVHRDPTIFPDPDAFEPERWLETSLADQERLAKMERAFLAFGAGSRICLGKNLSMIEMRKIVPRLLKEFEFSFVEAKEEWKVRGGWFVFQTLPACRIARR